MPSIIFFDIDGTLVAGGYAKDNYVPESAKLAIKKLEENGICYCFSCWRMFSHYHQTMCN